MNYDFIEPTGWDFVDTEVYSERDYYEVSQKLDDASEWLSEVVDLLYGKKEFNLTDLDNALNELGAYLGVKLPNKEMTVKIY